MITELQPPRAVSAPPPAIPLVVDLDGTLLRSDLLVESALGFVRASPASVFQLPGWLLQGKVRLKS
jgi:hypothetical protein